MLTRTKNLTLLLFLIALAGCNQCEVPLGKYKTSGGSEYNTELTLLADNKYDLLHETWQPGGYDKRKVKKVSGTWSCNKSELLLKIGKNTISAAIKSIGQNPLGLSQDTKVLEFRKDKIINYLDNGLLYLND